ncbi:MAG: FAD:protein FMN transferase [Opitutaceae bacterium]
MNSPDNRGGEAAVSAHEAMATTFRIHIAGTPAPQARQAAMAAFEEIDRLERILSRYREGSDVHRFNSARAGTWTRISADTAACLRTAFEISRLTDGAFDPALGALTGDPFSETLEFSEPAAAPGWRQVELDAPGLRARKLHEGVRLDLGAIGKGCAVDAVMTFLDDWDVPAVLIDSGGSTILARDDAGPVSRWTARLEFGGHAREVRVQRCALAGSGMAVKGAHIFDGRLGQPHHRAGRVWACAETAAVADALSTAFFIMPWNAVVDVCAALHGSGAAAVDETAAEADALRFAGAFAALAHDRPGDSA